MLLKDLRSKILNSKDGGVLKIGEVEVTYSDNEDVDFRSGVNLIGYIPSTTDGETPVQDVLSLIGGLRNIKYYLAVAQYLGFGVEEFEPIIKEIEVIKEVERETSETHKLRGMVDAYEKIIIGRELNVGR